MEALKANLEKRLDKSEEFVGEKITKQKDYVYDKIYEMKSHFRSQPNHHSQKDCSKRIEDIIKEQDRFNRKLSNVEKNQEDICMKIPAEMKELQIKFKSVKENDQEVTPLNSSIIEDRNDLSTISEIVIEDDIPHPNEESFGFSAHPTEAQLCKSKENLEWKTPDALHRSLNFTPGHSTARPQHRSAPANRYRLDYTASPAQDRDGETRIDNQSFLDKRRHGPSNL